MYYTSQDKSELVAYNELVTAGQNYSGVTTQWAEIIEHPNGVEFAILKHKKYQAKLTELETLTTDWFPEPIE